MDLDDDGIIASPFTYFSRLSSNYYIMLPTAGVMVVRVFRTHPVKSVFFWFPTAIINMRIGLH